MRINVVDYMDSINEHGEEKPLVSKDVFVDLAKAYQRQRNLEDKIYNSLLDCNKEYKAETDFVGLPMFSDIICNEVLSVLGSEFSYWYYECEQSFEKFNENVTLKDGGHPEVYNLTDLYDFAMEEE